MASTITVPQGFSYVGAALLSTVGVLVYQAWLVGKHRNRAGIKYPQLYAEKAEAEASSDAHLFNCAQRSHQNTLENIPAIYTLTLLAGLKFPILAASACGFWSVARVTYTHGYVSGDPKKRKSLLHNLSYIGVFAMFGASIYAIGDSILAGI